MGTRVHYCQSLDVAKGFLEGVEFVNDDAVRVTGCQRLSDGTHVVVIEDDDYDCTDVVLTDKSPVVIPLEVLRGD